MAREVGRLASDGYRAVALDLRGTGGSQRLETFGDAWLEDCAGDVAALIDHLGGDEAVVLGVSGDALIALLTAAGHPSAVRGGDGAGGLAPAAVDGSRAVLGSLCAVPSPPSPRRHNGVNSTP